MTRSMNPSQSSCLGSMERMRCRRPSKLCLPSRAKGAHVQGSAPPSHSREQGKKSPMYATSSYVIHRGQPWAARTATGLSVRTSLVRLPMHRTWSRGVWGASVHCGKESCDSADRCFRKVRTGVPRIDQSCHNRMGSLGESLLMGIFRVKKGPSFSSRTNYLPVTTASTL